MKWTYSIKNKLIASAVLLVLCVLVLISNYIDRNHTESVKTAISTLYEDRLIAEEYILKMMSGIYQLREVLNADIPNTNKNNIINNLLLDITQEKNAYQKTKFTEAEKNKAEELFTILAKFESVQLTDKLIKIESANKALKVLHELSAIQLEESKQIMANAESLYQSGKISSQFVFGIIIIILLVLQALVFASKTLTLNTERRSSNLN